MNPLPSTPPPMPQPATPGWWSRNWKWGVPVMAISMLALIVGFVFLIFFGIFGMMKSAEPCKNAFAKAAANPQVQVQLGVPIEEGFFLSGNVSTVGARGHATMSIPISGPKGTGCIYLQAKKSAGTWTYSTLEVTIEGKPEKIDLKP